MQSQSTLLAHIPLSFSVDTESPPQDRAIHDALRSVRAVEIEAPTLELAEFYAKLLLEAMEAAGN